MSSSRKQYQYLPPQNLAGALRNNFTISLPDFERFCHGISDSVNHLEQVDCPYHLFEAIGSLVPFKFAMSVVHQRDKPPVHIADTFANHMEKRAMALYLENTYILNPVYNAYLNGLKEGVYRMRDLAPDNYFSSDYYRQFKAHELLEEEIGYKTYGWPADMEELIIVINLKEDKMAEISLSRARRGGGFEEEDCHILRIIAPVLAAFYCRFWQNFQAKSYFQTNQMQKNEAQRSKNSVDSLLSGFDNNPLNYGSLGSVSLTKRECEVAYLILKGHSSLSISQHLHIKLTTVKTHRRNLYAKLSISTQQELFAAFLRSITSSVS